jgi:hypothetical protein
MQVEFFQFCDTWHDYATFPIHPMEEYVPFDPEVQHFVLSHDNYFANVLTANKGRIAVNSSDYTRNGFNDVTIAVGLTVVSLLLGLQP